MGIFDWLFRKTPAAFDPPPRIGNGDDFAPMGITEEIRRPTSPAPPQSEVTPLLGIQPTIRRSPLDPIFAMIEYRDAEEQLTRRRVTLRTAEDRDGILYLLAYCHERQALRTFRADRVQCVISQDGEVESARHWLNEITSGLTWETVDARAPQKTKMPAKAAPTSTYTALRRELSPALTVLIAAARSDDILHPREISSIMIYLENEAFDLRDAGKIPGNPNADDFAKMERTIRRLRPTKEDIAANAEAILGLPKPRLNKLAIALAKTAEADGFVDDVEQQMIEELRDLGTRRHGHGWDG